MKNICIPQRILTCLALALLFPSVAMAASLEPPAAPSAAGSAIYTTEDVYNRLQSGAVGAKRSGGFAEPSAGPAEGVGKTLDEIMALAPVPDNSTGLKPSEAPAGKPFWGFNQAAGGWGPQTSSNANVVDTTEATAPAAAATISAGKKAFVNGVAVTGTMPPPGVVFTCSGTLNGTRWCDRGNGTVLDMTTGLVWLKNAYCKATLNGVVKDTVLNWNDAEIWSAALASGQCGLTDGSTAGDWRLPTKYELFKLAISGAEPVTSRTPRNFSGVQSYYYWTSTTYDGSPDSAWDWDLTDRGTYGVHLKTEYLLVWPVRTGQ